jgi:hypothetical protein
MRYVRHGNWTSVSRLCFDSGSNGDPTRGLWVLREEVEQARGAPQTQVALTGALFKPEVTASLVRVSNSLRLAAAGNVEMPIDASSQSPRW